MSKKRFFDSHPFCCFCGGTRAVEEIEHQPSRIVFPNKHRPKGMEFPTCKRCNEQTRNDEPLLAFLCRLLGSERTTDPPDKGYRKALKSLSLRHPMLLQNMNAGRVWRGQNGILVRKGAFNLKHPQIDFSLCRIAAKLLLAIHYEIFYTAVGDGSFINTYWTHNQKSFSDVSNFLGMLPLSKALKQGEWESEGTFFVRYHESDGNLAVVGIFYEALALVAHMQSGGIRHSTSFTHMWVTTATNGLELAY